MAGEGALVDEVEEVDNELDEDPSDELELEDDLEDDVDDSDDADGSDESASEEADDESPVALDALEAEELEIVESDESATMLVDEASEIMAIRREEMTMDVEADAQRGDEFVCQSCFLVKKSSQLANKRKMLCMDCV